MSDTAGASSGKPAILGCIGCGNMGSAILKGLAGREGLSLIGTDVNAGAVKALAASIGLEAADTPKEVVENADYVLLCVKPHQMKGLLHDLAPHLQPRQTLISIAAGLTLEQLKAFSSGVCPVVRIMPNTPAMVGKGVFAVCLDDPALKDSQKDYVLGMFGSLGQTHVLAESYFDAFTAVAGSGPAYVFYFMEAVVEAGVALGLTRDQSTAMVKGLFTGSAILAEQSDHHLAQLREMVTSPAGTTIAATNLMDSHALRGRIIEAVKAACARSKELGK
ncbi:MAG: pyrroline-5-carboxylate reductase [Desulfovibrionaceae bacterium]